MKLAQKLILLVGLLALGLLFWKMDAALVWGMIVSVGWGFPLLLGQEIGAHVFNALGWRFAFGPEHAGLFPLRQLVRCRIIGDGVNYLTPSAQLAGEFARATLLSHSVPVEVRIAGVAVAKFAQGLAQMLFALFGVALFLRGRIPQIAPYEGLIRALAIGAGVVLAALLVLETLRPSPPRGARGAPEREGLWALPGRLKDYLRHHPGRFAFSICFYLLGFAWGALEGWLICRFLGLPVSPGTALAIESLSVVVDGVMFMVPAKAGTQEAGKTAIFALLGLPPATGLAFGVVRHIRELGWSSTGMFLYTRHLRSERKKG